MKGRNQHVIPLPEGWGVKGEGNLKYTAITSTRAEAEKIAREIARNQRSELIIHKRSGRIIDSDSYGKDPASPRDRIH